jgi:hypothetical protein
MTLGTLVLIAALPGAEARHDRPRGRAAPNRLAEACATALDKNIAAGRGSGMAFVADRNGYPGPLHALELKDELKPTGEQEAEVRAVPTAMLAESRPQSERLLAADDNLRRLFASGQASEAGAPPRWRTWNKRGPRRAWST